MTIKIEEVTTHKQLNSFIKFPFSIYKGNPYWTPPLLMDEKNTLDWKKNPAFEVAQARYWLANKDGKVVGRIAGIYNPKSNEKWGQHNVRFGWVDFIDDREVSRTLFETVENWARELGMSAVHGPLGFTDLDPEGMLIEGFDELSTLALIYNHPYYPVHLAEMGYVKDTDWLEYEIQVPNPPQEKIAKAAELTLKRFNLHKLELKKKKDLLNYTRELFDLIDSEYSHLYGTVPLSDKQKQAYIDQYFGFVSPDLVPIILDENNKMVAFAIVMPSFSKALQKSQGKIFPVGWIHFLTALKTNTLGDLYLIAVRSDYRGKGINAAIMHSVNVALNKHGITRVETNANLEDNINVQAQWKYFEHRQHKRRRCFIKHLS
jgi:N-acetylglutamate synthase-like GNAT family acetyltransferase